MAKSISQIWISRTFWKSSAEQKNPDSKISHFLHFCALGIDVYETVFDFCDGKETEEGLTLAEEMENKDCLSHLTTGFGMLEEDIPRHFQTFDENGDGLVSKQEGFRAYETSGLDRDTNWDNMVIR